ncbi:MAG: PaaI family thioesterase [Acidiferrobacterales bacterium]
MPSPTPSDPGYAERVHQSFAQQQIMDLIGAALVDVQPGYCEIHLPYRPELSQQDGYFHAGIISTIADSAAGYAGFTLMPVHSRVLTVEYKLNLLRPGDGERLIARGHVVNAGKTLVIAKADVGVLKNGAEKMCATLLQTLFTLTDAAHKPKEADQS